MWKCAQHLLRPHNQRLLTTLVLRETAGNPGDAKLFVDEWAKSNADQSNQLAWLDFGGNKLSDAVMQSLADAVEALKRGMEGLLLSKPWRLGLGLGIWLWLSVGVWTRPWLGLGWGICLWLSVRGVGVWTRPLLAQRPCVCELMMGLVRNLGASLLVTRPWLGLGWGICLWLSVRGVVVWTRPLLAQRLLCVRVDDGAGAQSGRVTVVDHATLGRRQIRPGRQRQLWLLAGSRSQCGRPAQAVPARLHWPRHSVRIPSARTGVVVVSAYSSTNQPSQPTNATNPPTQPSQPTNQPTLQGASHNLQWLDLSHNRLDAAFLSSQIIATVSACVSCVLLLTWPIPSKAVSLKSLRVSDCGLSSELFAQIGTAIGTNQRLTGVELVVSGNPGLGVNAALVQQTVQKLHNVTRLDMRSCGLSFGCAKSVMDLVNTLLCSLEALFIGGVGIGQLKKPAQDTMTSMMGFAVGVTKAS